MIADGFTYLGYEFSPILVSVRDESVERLRESIMKIFTNYKYSETHDLDILQWVLNLRITGCIYAGSKYGWLFFFSQIDDMKLLFRLDAFIKAQCERFGIDTSETKIKRFVRAYHEITKNLASTNYIPDFDVMTVKEKRRTLRRVFGMTSAHMTKAQVEYHFNKRIYRTVKELEKDLSHAS